MHHITMILGTHLTPVPIKGIRTEKEITEMITEVKTEGITGLTTEEETSDIRKMEA